ncbi:MAG: Rne/Rng family ribonuclease [Mailhella sp.]|nr:Rne/Rng family ribonuclease [Mailhella sp.]
MTDEDLEALDAAVNGNRIDAPARPQQKDERKNKKGKKAKDEKPAREEKKAKAKEEAPAADAAPKAKRVLYISVVPDEQVEVVITEDGLVTEYFVEMAHQVKIRGNIYKGVINNIDTNLQAAFVNFGNGKNGFLQIDEVHPEYYLVPHDATRGPKYPPIQKVLKVGQEVLVQVVKEPAGTKGAFLTTWISIAGRFLVLTPGQEQIGVSRKVEDPEERARLKELLNDIQPGENMGVIIRTASEGVNKDSIQQDLQFLKKLWKDIQKKAPVEKCPSLIYQEADLATRSVRDYLSDDIEEIWIDDESTKARVEEIVGVIFPDRSKDLVKLHKEQRQTLWERFNLLKQLETVTSREVVLPSGGRLVFDQTEALMAIDINSGKTQGKTNFEAMVFRTNMEAAEAIARHLRLRDIGGQVVIDFIEMRDKNHCREVERTIRNAMRRDRARHDVGHMSSFGLLELVRQRTGTSAISITTEPCPHCHGTGVRRNMEWQAQQAMRDLQTKLCKSLDSAKHKKGDQKNEKAELATFVYESDAELALYILNRKRDRIAALEEKFGVHIEVRLKP